MSKDKDLGACQKKTDNSVMSNVKYAFTDGFAEIKQNKVQALFSALGFVVAVATLIAVLIVTESRIIFDGYKDSPLGANSITLKIESEKSEIDIKDLEEFVKQQQDLLIDVVPFETAENIETYGSTKTSEKYSVLASDSDFFDHASIKFVSGRPFTQADVSSRNQVAVISQDIAEKIFNESQPVGQDIKINNQVYKVVGIFVGEKSYAPSGSIVIPYSGSRLILNSNNISTYNFILKNGKDSDIAVKTIEGYVSRNLTSKNGGLSNQFTVKSNYNSGAANKSRQIAIIIYVIILIASGFGIIMFAMYPSKKTGYRTDVINGNYRKMYAFLRKEFLCFLIVSVSTIVGLTLGGLFAILYCLIIDISVIINGATFLMLLKLFLISVVFSIILGSIPGIFSSKQVKRDMVK